MSQDKTADAAVEAAAGWLMSDDSLYEDNPELAKRVARGMLAAATAAMASRLKSTTIFAFPGEPTAVMLAAAHDWSAEKYGKPIGHEAARGCWEAMLNAAREADNAE